MPFHSCGPLPIAGNDDRRRGSTVDLHRSSCVPCQYRLEAWRVVAVVEVALDHQAVTSGQETLGNIKQQPNAGQAKLSGPITITRADGVVE